MNLWPNTKQNGARELSRYLRGIVVRTLLVALSICPVKVFALDDPPYMLTRLGSMTISDKDANNQHVLGVVVGMRLNFSFYVEAEVNLPMAGGDYVNDTEKGSIDVTTAAIYGAYRYVLSSDYYAKLKAGIVYEDVVRRDDVAASEVTSGGAGGAGGAGLGIVYHVNKKPVMLELEFTAIDKGVALYSLGMTYPF